MRTIVLFIRRYIFKVAHDRHFLLTPLHFSEGGRQPDKPILPYIAEKLQFTRQTLQAL